MKSIYEIAAFGGYPLMDVAQNLIALVLFASAPLLVMLRIVQIRWTRTWAEKGGRARSTPTTVGTSGARRTA